VDIPIFGSDEVADVTGAGDTVIAAFTLRWPRGQHGRSGATGQLRGRDRGDEAGHGYGFAGGTARD
jgi:sugar/nucleoside kinase (ribokinase family)